MDSGPISRTPTVGGEVLPQTPAFPTLPQTPYFNLCKFPFWLIEGSDELRDSYCIYSQQHDQVLYLTVIVLNSRLFLKYAFL